MPGVPAQFVVECCSFLFFVHNTFHADLSRTPGLSLSMTFSIHLDFRFH